MRMYGVACTMWQRRRAQHNPLPSQDFDVRNGVEEGPYLQYFDVFNTPLQQDASTPPPAWAPNAFFRLSFTQSKFDLSKSVVGS